jgi:FixJ family two-component response regulator
MAQSSLVSIVDDDESVRESLPDLLREFGFSVQAFSSAEAFLQSEWMALTQCLVLDIAMPGMTGPELQRELAHREPDMPIVFMTAHATEVVRPGVIGKSAVACLIKPFSPGDLLEAINAGLRRGRPSR